MAPYKTTTVLNYILECSLYILEHIINAYCCPVYIFESSSYISDIYLNAYHMLVDLFLNGVWWCYNHRVWPILVCIYMFFFLTFIVCFCIYFSDCQRGQDTGFTISILSSRHVMNVYCSLVWLKCLLCIFLIWRPSYFDLYMYFQVIIIYSGHILNINCLSLYKLIRTYLQSTFLLRSCRSIFS